MNQFDIREILGRNKVIPVVTIESLDKVDALVAKLIAQDISCIEVTLRTPIAMDALKLLKEKYSDKLDVGVGTIVSKEQLKQVAEIGVDFIVSPGLMQHLFDELQSYKIAFIPGVVTSSEIIQGMALGYDTFKFFPAELVGGLPMLKIYASLFPHVKFCPTGGIKETNFEAYLALPNVICVGGSWVVA